jgi:hypothetical protein
MPLFNGSRKKSVTFRLSTEELEALRSYCIGKKIRSVSELARESILQQVGERGNRTLASGDLVALGSALEETVTALKNLGKIITVLSPSEVSDLVGRAP